MKQQKLTVAQVAHIKALLLHTDLWQHQIAAIVGVNQGRVSEIKNGKRFRAVAPGNISDYLK